MSVRCDSCGVVMDDPPIQHEPGCAYQPLFMAARVVDEGMSLTGVLVGAGFILIAVAVLVWGSA